MGRYGFGFGARHRAVRNADASAPPVSASPGQTWSGIAGSGFATIPVDPVRTTAKPAMRLMVPPGQAYTDDLLVGAYAAANNGGTLFGDMGLEKVRVHYEGTIVDITAPTFATFDDANGNPVTYYGWWARLAHDGRNGDANLYLEAIPKDATMQARVMGPYLFMPSATLYDLELTVAPSLSQITGSRYQTITAALTYCAQQARHRPRITITEARTDYTLANIGSPFSYTTGKGFATIEAAVPVTIIGTATYVDSTPRTKYCGMRFKGSNITFDFANASVIFAEATGNKNWLDGITVINSRGRGGLFPGLGGPRPYGTGCHYATECTISDLPTALNGAFLARGNMVTKGFSDALTDCVCAVGNRLDDHDSYVDWAKEVPAFTVTYTGTGTTATLELSGFNDNTTRVFTAKVNGASVGSFTVNKYYSVANGRNSSVVAWLNGLPGWAATLQDDTRRVTFCSNVGGKGAAFGPINCKNTALQIVTMFDQHGDVWQHLINGVPENVIVADNVITNFAGQCFFIASTTPARDFIFLNNCYHGKPTVPGSYNIKENFYSQLDRSGVKSHVVIAHNSSTQGWWLRPASGFDADAYCMWANNAMLQLSWLGTPDADIRIANNHIMSSAPSPGPDTATVIGGSETSLWQNAAAGNFRPAGELLANPKAPVLKFDRTGKKRGSVDSVGAIAS